jgi:hypothetical protein
VLLLNYIGLAEHYHSKKLVQTKIKELIRCSENDRKVQGPVLPLHFNFKGFVRMLKENLRVVLELRLPFYFLTDAYLNCSKNDPAYLQFHDKVLPEALERFLKRPIQISGGSQFIYLASNISKKDLPSVMLDERTFSATKRGSFYRDNFSPWFQRHIPLTQKKSRLLFAIHENSIVFLLLTHRNLLIEARVFLFVPIVRLKDMSRSDLVTMDLDLSNLANFNRFSESLFNDSTCNCTSVLVQHLVLFMERHKLAHNHHYNVTNVKLAHLERNDLAGIPNNQRVIEQFFSEKLSTGALPAIFPTYIDTSRLNLKGEVRCKTFLFWEQVEATKQLFNIIDEVIMDSSKILSNNECTSPSGLLEPRVQAFLMLSVLFNSTKEDQELVYRARHDDILLNARNTLFRNYYLPLLLWTSLRHDQMNLQKTLSMFPCISVSSPGQESAAEQRVQRPL